MRYALALFFFFSASAQCEIFTDLRGKQVSVPHTPKRYVALMPALAEVLIDLGVADLLVATPDYSEIPEKDKSHVKNLGAYPHISAEAVYLLKADVIVANIDGNDPALVQKLEALKQPVVVVDTRSLKKITESILLLAEITGRADAKVKAQKFSSEIQTLRNAKGAAAAETVFLQLGWDPLVSVSGNSFMGEALSVAGYKNIFQTITATYPRPSPEEILAANPDHIVICPMTENIEESEKSKGFWGKFPKLRAVKTNRIHVMRPGVLTKPGFKLLDGIKALRSLK